MYALSSCEVPFESNINYIWSPLSILWIPYQKAIKANLLTCLKQKNTFNGTQSYSTLALWLLWSLARSICSKGEQKGSKRFGCRCHIRQSLLHYKKAFKAVQNPIPITLFSKLPQKMFLNVLLQIFVNIFWKPYKSTDFSLLIPALISLLIPGLIEN